MNDVPVIVAGAGPVGLATALGLARSGIEVKVLEREAQVSHSPRALAYLFPVFSGFDRLGVLEDLLREGFKVNGMNFVIFDSGEQIHHDLDPVVGHVDFPFNTHLGQDQVSRILLRHLSALPNVEICYNTEVLGLEQDDDGVTVKLSRSGERDNERAGWLVGADGASSAVRRHLGLGFEGSTWPDRFIATNIKYDFESHGFKPANWVVDPTYGAIVAKINDAGLWRYTYRESADLPAETYESRIPEHLAQALPGHGSYELMQSAPYKMHQRSAESFRVGRVLLAGDAAHVTNPTGGLGLMGGFLDAFVLHEVLAAVIAGIADDSVLSVYACERQRVFRDVVSPAATENKKIVFDLADQQRRTRILAGLRDLATDPDKRRVRLMSMCETVTPSLLARV